MIKDSVVSLLQTMITQVQALPDDVPVDTSGLQAKLDAANAALADDDQKVIAATAAETALQAKIDAAKAALA